jgi:Condensation domain
MAARTPLVVMRQRAAQARPVPLARARRLWVPFEGERGGEAPVTLGQASTLQWVTDTSVYNRMVEWPLTLPAGAEVAGIAVSLSILLGRHEVLRTTFPAGPGSRVQRVARRGYLALDIFEVPGDQPADVLTVALIGRLRAAEFDLSKDLPVRAAMVTRHGSPVAAVLLYSHIAVDFASMALIDRQFTHLVSDPAARVPGERGHQPLDQAAVERAPRGKRMTEAALRAWEASLRVMPQCLYAAPASGAGGGPAAGWLWSRAAALALPRITARTGATKQVTVLAALCAVLAWRARQDRCVMAMSVTNRTRPRLRGYVGPLSTDGLLLLGTKAASFDELVHRATIAALKANRSGPVDRARLLEITGQVEHARGIAYTRDCAFNDISGFQPDDGRAAAAPGAGPEQIAGALADSRFVRLPATPIDELLLLILHRVEGELMLGALTADAGRVPPEEIESLLRGADRLLAAAAGGDLPLAGLGGVTGLAPLPRGDGWLLADSCWVELAEVQRLLSDACPTAAARVFALAGAAGSPRLVAYLTATECVMTPGQAHAACMRLLAGHGRPRQPGGPRYTAMAPGHYVICARAPADTASLTQWRRQTVIAQGDGRRRP